jgi:hypothetical protein
LLAGKRGRQVPVADLLVAGAGAFVVQEAFRTPASFPHGLEEMTPWLQAMIGGVENAPSQKRAAEELQEVSAFDGERIDGNPHANVY